MDDKSRPRRIRRIGIAVVLVWLALSATGLLLGAPSGQNWLGRGLAVFVPLALIVFATMTASAAARLRAEAGDLRRELDELRAGTGPAAAATSGNASGATAPDTNPSDTNPLGRAVSGGAAHDRGQHPRDDLATAGRPAGKARGADAGVDHASSHASSHATFQHAPTRATFLHASSRTISHRAPSSAARRPAPAAPSPAAATGGAATPPQSDGRGTPPAGMAEGPGSAPQFASARDQAGPVAARAARQGELALDPAPSAAAPPLPIADLIQALHFPEGPDDTDGFRALRRAMRDPRTGPLIQAAQDVLTILSEDGLYMEDLAPDRARPALWRQFAQGERGGPIGEVGGIRDRASLAHVATRMREDPVFRDAAHHFLRRFDRLLAGIAPEIDDATMIRLTDTRTARAFMLIGRTTGMFD